jgi:hypothetical protein
MSEDYALFTATTTGSDPLAIAVPVTGEAKYAYRLTDAGRIVYSVYRGLLRPAFELRTVGVDEGADGRIADPPLVIGLDLATIEAVADDDEEVDLDGRVDVVDDHRSTPRPRSPLGEPPETPEYEDGVIRIRGGGGVAVASASTHASHTTNTSTESRRAVRVFISPP